MLTNLYEENDEEKNVLLIKQKHTYKLDYLFIWLVDFYKFCYRFFDFLLTHPQINDFPLFFDLLPFVVGWTIKICFGWSFFFLLNIDVIAFDFGWFSVMKTKKIGNINYTLNIVYVLTTQNYNNKKHESIQYE